MQMIDKIRKSVYRSIDHPQIKPLERQYQWVYGRSEKDKSDIRTVIS